MLNRFQDQAAGLRKMMLEANPQGMNLDLYPSNESHYSKQLGAQSVEPFAQDLAVIFAKSENHCLIQNYYKKMNQDPRIIFLNTEENWKKGLPLPVIKRGKLILQINQNSDSIKRGYGVAKWLSKNMGLYSFGVLVKADSLMNAKCIFENIKDAAKEYLDVRMQFSGHLQTPISIKSNPVKSLWEVK